MSKLIICCDGTWDFAGKRTDGVPTPSNVARFFNATLDADRGYPEQRKYYHPGVGTGAQWWRHLVGGAFGFGLGPHIQSAYRWLGTHYTPGDDIYCLGFSRGAFTVRSLVGMIEAIGLLDLACLDDDQAWPRVTTAYEQGYRKNAPHWQRGWRLHANGQPIPIRFLGVWDTVGALGIPDTMALLNFFDDPQRYAFLNTRLGGHVQTARQAVALDERWASFTPTLWHEVAPNREVEQLWFPGVHADVGGGSYPDTGLADIALQWMLEQAGACGLAIDERMQARLKPDPRGILHESATGLFSHLRTRPRSTPPITATDAFHPAAIERHADPPIFQTPYWPTTVLAPGEQCTVEIFARTHWNATGVYLEPGARYECCATGQWMNGATKCGPDGAPDERSLHASLYRGLRALAGTAQSAYRHLSGHENAVIPGTNREPDSLAGTLIGAIANGGNPAIDGSPEPHQTIVLGCQARIPAGCALPDVEMPGYLYCYMNDAWYCYRNNKGSVRLTVKRTA